MPLLKPFWGQDKQENPSYSAVEVDTDSLDSLGTAGHNADLPPKWPIRAQRVSRGTVWMALGCLSLVVRVAFIGDGSTGGTGHNLEALLYASRTGYSLYQFFLWESSMNTIKVEASTICQSDECSVDRLRRADTQDNYGLDWPKVFTPWDVKHVWNANSRFVSALASLEGEATVQSVNPVDAYIFNETQWVQGTGQQNWSIYVSELQKAKDLSHRLTKVLNTYFDSLRWGGLITTSYPFAKKTLNSTGQPIQELVLPYNLLETTAAVVTLLVPVYKVNALWAYLLIVCSSALLLLNIFGIFAQVRTVAPDIFNHASSLTRDNPHFNAPVGGSGLDGAERARLLKRMRVQLGDTAPHSDTGYIASRSVNSSKHSGEGKIRKERLYR
ncbi:hypothetical protein N0V86_003683 [Didymella sp. IMI 355093]|nr:hypothetical protein N0V86_003683 [Didymella sp. IMI 355093]